MSLPSSIMAHIQYRRTTKHANVKDYIVWFYLYGYPEIEIYRHGKQTSGCLGLGVGGGLTSQTNLRSIWDDECSNGDCVYTY